MRKWSDLKDTKPIKEKSDPLLNIINSQLYIESNEDLSDYELKMGGKLKCVEKIKEHIEKITKNREIKLLENLLHLNISDRDKLEQILESLQNG